MAEKSIEHLGLILDGNRRWARKRGLSTFEGHKKGYEIMKQAGQWCLDRGIQVVTAFVFSTENWIKRTPEEVKYLLDLFLFFLEVDIREFHEKEIRLRVLGRSEGLSSKLLKLIEKAEKLTKNNTRGTLQIAFNYGGRMEIVDACKKIISSGVSAEKVDEGLISRNLYGPGVKDPDLIIRTSGERRLSGFLLWQAAYSEFLFLDKYWPDFSERDLDLAIKDYAGRERRYGR